MTISHSAIGGFGFKVKSQDDIDVDDILERHPLPTGWRAIPFDYDNYQGKLICVPDEAVAGVLLGEPVSNLMFTVSGLLRLTNIKDWAKTAGVTFTEEIPRLHYEVFQY